MSKRRRLTRGRPSLSLGLYNSAWQRHGDRKVARYVAGLGRGKGRPTGVAGVEMHDRGGRVPMRLGEFLGPQYDVAQDLSGGQRAGQAFALRKGTGWRIVGRDLIPLSPAGRNVGPRFIREVTLEHKSGVQRVVGVTHFPLPHTGLQDEAREVLKRWVNVQRRRGIPFVILADINSNHVELRKFLRLPKSAAVPGDVMACLWSKGWGRVAFSLDLHAPQGTDHGVLVMHSGRGALRMLARNSARRVLARMARPRVKKRRKR